MRLLVIATSAVLLALPALAAGDTGVGKGSPPAPATTAAPAGNAEPAANSGAVDKSEPATMATHHHHAKRHGKRESKAEEEREATAKLNEQQLQGH